MNNGRGTGREAGTRTRWEQKVIVRVWEWVWTWTWMRTGWCGGKRVGMGWDGMGWDGMATTLQKPGRAEGSGRR